ncbi:hypothetical protein FACS1894199_05700 [Bacteroidia bacterium]|nr:hypothetical protein FACS1894199_05700 [Bacteroidia bacterium]
MENKTAYDADFYKANVVGSLGSAGLVLPIVLEVIPKINSAVDFGCGLGTWLAALKTLGVDEIRGYDGRWVDKGSLKISPEYFTAVELDKGVRVNKKYDLAISLEVAEHLPKQSAELFVESLVNASDIVLFSAAAPYQGGTEHINEQWPDYWANIFSKHGYIAIDYIRKRIWNIEQISYYYRQNVLLFVKKTKKNKY